MQLAWWRVVVSRDNARPSAVHALTLDGLLAVEAACQQVPDGTTYAMEFNNVERSFHRLPITARGPVVR